MYENATFDGSFCTFDSGQNKVQKVITFDYHITILPSSDIQSTSVVYSYYSEGTINIVGTSSTRKIVASILKTEFKSKIVPFWIGTGTVFEKKSKFKLIVAPWLVGDPLSGGRVLK